MPVGCEECAKARINDLHRCAAKYCPTILGNGLTPGLRQIFYVIQTVIYNKLFKFTANENCEIWCRWRQIIQPCARPPRNARRSKEPIFGTGFLVGIRKKYRKKRKISRQSFRFFGIFRFRHWDLIEFFNQNLKNPKLSRGWPRYLRIHFRFSPFFD